MTQFWEVVLTMVESEAKATAAWKAKVNCPLRMILSIHNWLHNGVITFQITVTKRILMVNKKRKKSKIIYCILPK